VPPTFIRTDEEVVEEVAVEEEEEEEEEHFWCPGTELRLFSRSRVVRGEGGVQ
jgi:hypothetical protein